mmetsp:Transcript_26891/g.60289  ORF Transcript_26891/g.60289 Transcript_26891/m.60289 type:complete len:670 (+) Transcript_26891:57-2066(+)
MLLLLLLFGSLSLSHTHARARLLLAAAAPLAVLGAASLGVRGVDDGGVDGLELLLHAAVLLRGALGVLGGAVVEPRLDLGDLLVDGVHVVRVGDTVELGDTLGGLVAVVLELGAGGLGEPDPLVVLVELLGLGEHAVDLVGREAAAVVADLDRVGAAGGLVLGLDGEDAVGVDGHRDADLGHTALGREDTRELKLAEEVVVGGARALALVDLEGDLGLVVLDGRVGVGLGARDGRVALDDGGHDLALGLDTQRERGHVEEEEVLGALARGTDQDGALDGGAVGDGLVGVDAGVRLLAVEKVLEQGLDLGDAGGAADEDNLVNLRLLKVGVLEHVLDGLERLLEEVRVHLLKLGAGERLGKVLAVKEGVDLEAGRVGLRQRALGLLGLAPELGEGALVLGDVLAVLLLDEVHKVLHDPLVKVLTAEMRVAVGRHDLKDAVVDRQDRHVKGAAAEVKDEDRERRGALGHAALLLEPVRDRGRGRLVDDAEHVEASEAAGVLGRLALLVVEVGRHGHDGLGHVAAEVGLGGLLHLDQDHRRDLLGAELAGLAVELDLDVGPVAVVGDDLERPVLRVAAHRGVAEVAADEALGVKDRVVRVDGRLVLGAVADEALAVLAKGDVRGGRPVALVVGNDLDAVLLPDTNARVRRAEVDADAHGVVGGGVLGLRHGL